jgi:hypothetical protein
MKTHYQIGDFAWIYLRNHNGNKTKSTVVHSFQLDYGPTYYVCEVSTPVDPLLEVRDSMSMAACEVDGIGLLELIKSASVKGGGK